MNIKELRKKLGLSQQALADATGIPKARIGQWEIGKGSPKVEDYETLNNFFIKKGLTADGATIGEPGNKMNPERALVLAMLDDYAEYKSMKEDVPYDTVKGEIQRKARLILKDLDSWLPE